MVGRASRGRASAVLSVVLLLVLGVAPAPARARRLEVWHRTASLHLAATGISCPSRSLCVAVDRAGRVAVSTRSSTGERAWRRARVDAGNVLTGIACPSTTLCVAVDNAGHVVASTRPAAGAGAWHVTNVEGATPFVSIACPSTRLCVGAADHDLLVSRSPAGGASAWTIDHSAATGTGPECGKYGPTLDCYASLVLLSCPQVTFCEGIDGYADLVTGDPLTQTWRSSDGDGQQIDGLACLSGSSCLTLCADGAGYGGTDCGGEQGPYDASVLCGLHGCFALSQDAPIGLWCTPRSACFAADGNGNLFASDNPTGGAHAWRLVYQSAASNDPHTVVGVACPSASTCIAVTDHGDILAGPAPPRRAQIRRRALTN